MNTDESGHHGDPNRAVLAFTLRHWRKIAIGLAVLVGMSALMGALVSSGGVQVRDVHINGQP